MSPEERARSLAADMCPCFGPRDAERAIAAAIRAADAHGWRPIAEAPRDGTAVLVYCARMVFPDQHGHSADLGASRDHVERTSIGWYEDGVWHEAGTAHDMFEPWHDPADLPTHWQPLPAPPEDR